MNRHRKFFVISIALVIAMISVNTRAPAQDIDRAMTSFLQTKIGKRVAGGASSHLAAEALRVGGGEFVPSDLGADSPGAGDRVWGDLITLITANGNDWSDSNPDAASKPGDVIQYGRARFDDANFGERHTSIVAGVDDNGRPNQVYQQNVDGNRTVIVSDLDVRALTSGWLRIYRPKPRQDAINVWKFAVVNKALSNQDYGVIVEIANVESVELNEANTSGSYRIHKIATDGTVPAILLDNGGSMYVQNAKAYEFLDGDLVHIRQKKN